MEIQIKWRRVRCAKFKSPSSRQCLPIALELGSERHWLRAMAPCATSHQLEINLDFRALRRLRLKYVRGCSSEHF